MTRIGTIAKIPPMNRAHIILLVAILLFGLPGCVTIPVKQATLAIEPEELASDVNFLAQPALKGRQFGTIESQIARRFITARYKQYGLVPWLGTNRFEQPFGLGTNVIGTLLGSDPNLASQIIILSAHYDHLGSKKEGIYAGACDNASGVAALLEIAENLALSSQRPRRTIAFAAFDSEEQLAMGAFAFTCANYFDQKKIAGVVNVDMLGRDFLGAVPKSLFLVGTESYPDIREHIISVANRTSIKILPIGTMLVGPTGDHIPFETINVPVLFFTCGFFPDYHKPTDTPEKLNYSDIKDSTEIIADTVRYLASIESVKQSLPSQPVQKYELETLDYALTIANANQERLKSPPRRAEMQKKLAERIRLLLAKDSLSRNDRLGLVTDIITPAIELANLEFQLDPNIIPYLSAIFTSHRIFLIEQVRGFVKVVIKNKPPIFGKMKYQKEAYDLTDDLIDFTQTTDGQQYSLYALLPKISITFEVGGLPFPKASFGFSYSPIALLYCTGSIEQITDYCLLKWRKDINDQSLSRACQKLLAIVTATDRNWTYNQRLQSRLSEGSWADEKDWVSALTKSSTPSLAAEANQIEMQIAVQNAQYDKLLPLVDKLNNDTPCDLNDLCEKFLEAVGPFADYPFFFGLCREPNTQHKRFIICPTPADSALQQLRTLTGQKFGKDKNAWRKWIEVHIK